MKSYDGLPIVPHLLDLLHAIRDDGITLTLAGGLGLYLKRAEVVRRIQSEGLSTLRPIFPEARGTSDMDLFVHLELFVMKLQAVLDRARGLQKSYGYKHAFDVYLLLAMMTEREWDEACGFARETYAREPILMDLKAAAGGLFAADDAPGCIDIRANFEGTREVGEIDLPWMREVLAELMA